MSNLLDQPTHNGPHMQVDSAGPGNRSVSNKVEDEFSDFEADPEELEIIEQLLREAAAKHIPAEDASLVVTDIEDYEAPRGVHLPKVFGLENAQQWNHQSQVENQQLEPGVVQVVRDQGAELRTRSEDEKDAGPERNGESPSPEDTEKTAQADTRSPLDRFRRPPKKALSVTDLVSPAWCELQYFYVLTKHGRKRRTPAMKQGSAVHQALEDEVHVTVPVTITKKEDSWGLRIWNIIQGLQTLRETGRTREFEIWGTVGGELVNGVIDELSYDCPDPKLEEQSLKLMGKQENEPPMPEYQASIRDYLVSSEHREQGQSISEALANSDTEGSRQAQTARNPKDEKRIYITDVKTRGISSLPTGSSIRPTIVQLHLYHHMLENLAQGNFSLDQLSTRYKFDVNETFSDAFIAQIGSLNQEAFDLVNSQRNQNVNAEDMDEFIPSTQDSMDIILQHNNISSLWQYMLSQFQETFIVGSTSSVCSFSVSNNNSQQLNPNEPPSATPQSISSLTLPAPPPLPTRLSPLLTAQYVSSKLKRSNDSSKPRLLGSKSIIFNPSFLKGYLYDALAFWRGERHPKGVVLSDAWKCRGCEFRDECAWVKEQDERVLKESMERRRARDEGDGSGVVGDEVKRSRV